VLELAVQDNTRSHNGLAAGYLIALRHSVVQIRLLATAVRLLVVVPILLCSIHDKSSTGHRI